MKVNLTFWNCSNFGYAIKYLLSSYGIHHTVDYTEHVLLHNL